ncbi:MAG: prephenate dehydratase [Actinomycetota bacterium]
MSPTPRVAFQGERGAYSEDAVHRFFGECEAQPLPTVRAVFEQVEIGATDFGVVPLENSQAGSINETYDLLVRHGVKLVGEVVTRVDHALLGLAGASLSEIRRVYSHPQALAQCEEFLATLEAEVVPFHDTAGAAKRVADEGKRDQAAVAGRRAAELYGLEVLTDAIQTFPENYTKFGVIGAGPTPSGGSPDKTSIVFAVADVPGSLLRCLGGFAKEEINLVKLESRPQGGRPWRYLMYLDFEAGAEEPRAKAALEELSAHTSFVRILGSYPSWRD